MKNKYLLALLRISIGFIFFWSFIDKVFGLSFATVPDKSWLQGISPTAGFLRFGTEGPFSSIFQNMSGNMLIDFLFMSGLLLAGTALILGIGIKIAGYSGSLMMFLIYLSLFPSQNNPIIDEHIIYILLLLLFTTTPTGNTWGLGRWWSRTKIVKKYPILN